MKSDQTVADNNSNGLWGESMEIDDNFFPFDQSKSSHWITVWKDTTWSGAEVRPDIAFWCCKTIGIPCILVLKQFEAGYV